MQRIILADALPKQRQRLAGLDDCVACDGEGWRYVQPGSRLLKSECEVCDGLGVRAKKDATA